MFKFWCVDKPNSSCFDQFLTVISVFFFLVDDAIKFVGFLACLLEQNSCKCGR